MRRRRTTVATPGEWAQHFSNASCFYSDRKSVRNRCRVKAVKVSNIASSEQRQQEDERREVFQSCLLSLHDATEI